MKKIIALSMILAALMVCLTAAYAQEDQPQFPFLAQTNELAVNLRLEKDSDSELVGRLERGQELTVLSAEINETGEVWYSVILEDGTAGYVRSDLLVASELLQAELEAYRAAYGETQGEYIGNKKSKKFHYPSCHTLPKETNRVYFTERSEAIEKGYDPCGNCNP